ncbi:MAG: VIT1/CCC1 transporter family protein [Candidatus Magasanikbacteria bacterium]|nr:VIT1/CCC1 transporter family protein [Candidatus Magasanikbacteria bacterium]
MSMRHHYNPHYIHHQDSVILPMIREIVFGMEDGMVSTLGAITGIAAATNDHFTVVLSGFVVVAVESISMGIGSYLSNKSEQDVNYHKIREEKEELQEFPYEERNELRDMYVDDGWPHELAEEMATAASKNKKLFLQEMIVHELNIPNRKKENPVRNALYMFFSYVIGGSIPLVPYLVFSINTAIVVSIIITLVGLFLLGVGTTKFTKRTWWKAGLEMCTLASVAAFVGYGVGQLVDMFLLK